MARYFDPDRNRAMFGSSGVLDAFKANRIALDMFNGTSIAEAMKLNTRVADLYRMPSFTSAMKLNTGVTGLYRTPGIVSALDVTNKLGGISTTPGFAEAMKMNKNVLAGFTTARYTDAIQANVTALNGITQSPGFMTAMRVSTTPISDLIRGGAFDSMIATSVLPKYDWTNVLKRFQGIVDEALVDVAAAEFDAAADVTSDAEDDGDTWWVLRLPLLVQFGLLLSVLEVIDKAGEFMGDVTGEDVPQSYRTGVQLLFCLAYALTAIIDAKAKVDEDDEPPEA